MRIDTHAHVFLKDYPVVAGARHAPTHDASPEQFLAVLDAHGITHALLTATSFYSTDNTLLLDALRRYPTRFRGTVMLAPGTPRSQFEALDRAGVVGIRYNLFGIDALPDFDSPDLQAIFEEARRLDWHIEFYGEAPKLGQLFDPLFASGVRIVLDHFARPDVALGTQCPVFQRVLRALPSGRVWVKLSAPYRLAGADPRPLARALMDAGGDTQLVWASDWPWTQNAAGLDYARVLGWLDDWVPDASTRARIHGTNAATLLKLQD